MSFETLADTPIAATWKPDSVNRPESAWWRSKSLSRDSVGRKLSEQPLDSAAIVQLEDTGPGPSLPPEPTRTTPAAAPQPQMLIPDVLDRPIERALTDEVPPIVPGSFVQTPVDAPLGYTGKSSVLPSEGQESEDFIPMEDRWRAGFPEWDRYGRGHPLVDDYPYVEGNLWDPFNQNVLKGDYPIIGQHTFLNITATSNTMVEFRELPTPTTPFESTRGPGQQEFFGDPRQVFVNQLFILQTDIFHGNAAFKPVDWRIRLTPIINLNNLDVNELAIVNPDVRDGTTRFRDDVALEEYFVEAKLADIGPDYDFVSMRAGSQPFTSDFRGFIFSDINRGVRLFGTRLANRDQFNVVYFDQLEKETNSTLNTFDDRHQNVLIANYYRQDFIFPGYTAQASFHYNHDKPSFKFDKNDFLVRPDASGIFQEHQVDAYYFGLTGDGHIDRFNISNAFYWAIGDDSNNPIGNEHQDINAMMAAVELSYDRDWVRFRTSFFWASGDDDVNDGKAEGFDTILDNPNFAGGQFSYWVRQGIPLFGVNLTNRFSLVPDLRSSKIQGQSNFVNPGLLLANIGMDFDITPKVKLITNANYIWFDTTEVLEQFTFQGSIDRDVGTDLSMGLEYRPFLNDNVIILGGLSLFVPTEGFDDLYGSVSPQAFVNDVRKVDANPLYSNFLQIALTY